MIPRLLGTMFGLTVVSAVACGSSDSTPPNAGDQTSSSGSTSGAFGSTGGPEGDGGASSSGGGSCKPRIIGVVRDFRAKGVPNGHPDFQAFEGTDATTGLVADTLGPDKKPVFKSLKGAGQENQLTSKEDFDVWYRNTDNVNESFEHELLLQPGANGLLTFSSNAFFPIDGRGFGNSGKDRQDVDRNFHFTFELHLEFVYKGGESFTFTGDDDLWTFFNGRLGIDLGGLHPARSKTIHLDERAQALGIEKGKTYPLDVFHAERRTDQSNFRIDTSLEFVNCNKIILLK